MEPHWNLLKLSYIFRTTEVFSQRQIFAFLKYYIASLVPLAFSWPSQQYQHYLFKIFTSSQTNAMGIFFYPFLLRARMEFSHWSSSMKQPNLWSMVADFVGRRWKLMQERKTRDGAGTRLVAQRAVFWPCTTLENHPELPSPKIAISLQAFIRAHRWLKLFQLMGPVEFASLAGDETLYCFLHPLASKTVFDDENIHAAFKFSWFQTRVGLYRLYISC